MIERLAIFGVGLIGGSFALALKRAGVVRQVVGYGRNRANLDKAVELGVIDAVAESPADAVAGADCVFLAMPVGAMDETLAAIAPHLGADALITDAGSTKQNVIAAARERLGSRVGQFIPGHPIAGAENSGVAAARVDLYDGKNLILTPLPENSPADVANITALWQAAGAQVLNMPAEQHDRVFAAVSHLPHLAAFALVDELAGRPESDLYFRHAGSGFRDFTRIAASSPEMWRDIALANQPALLGELDTYIERLTVYRNALADKDGMALLQAFSRARAARAGWPQSMQNPENESS